MRIRLRDCHIGALAKECECDVAHLRLRRELGLDSASSNRKGDAGESLKARLLPYRIEGVGGLSNNKGNDKSKNNSKKIGRGLFCGNERSENPLDHGPAGPVIL